jgi:hypothetical protein
MCLNQQHLSRRFLSHVPQISISDRHVAWGQSTPDRATLNYRPWKHVTPKFRIIQHSDISPRFIASQTEKKKVFFHPMLPDFRKSNALWQVPRLRPFVLVIVVCRYRWVWEHCWNESDQGKPKYSKKKSLFASVSRSHVDLPGIEPGPPRWQAGGLSHDTAIFGYKKLQHVPQREHSSSITKTNRFFWGGNNRC